MLFSKKIKRYIALLLIFFSFGIFLRDTKVSRAATFVENFQTDTYLDVANTTADWELDTSTAHLINGDWRQADNGEAPYLYEIISSSGGFEDPYAIKDWNNQPIVIYHGGTSLAGYKWTVDSWWCGYDCWTDLEDTSANPATTDLNVSGSLDNIKVIRNKDGYPAVLMEISESSQVHLYYTQYTPGVGWTYADGETSGYEAISNLTRNVNQAEYLFVNDNDGYPTVFWNEGGSPLRYFYTRWNGSAWTYADKTTTGKEEVVSIAAATGGNADLDIQYGSGNNIYFGVGLASFNKFLFKWNGTNWQDLDGDNFSSVPTTSTGDLTGFGTGGSNINVFTNNAGDVYAARIVSAKTYLAKRVSGSWKYADGSTDGIENIFEGASVSLKDFSVAKNGNVLAWGLINSGNSSAEYVFAQWNGSDWVQADGQTAGYETVSDTTDGYFLSFYSKTIIDKNNYPLFYYTNLASGSAEPVYLARFTGNDIKGADKVTNDQDTIIGTERNGGASYYNVWYDNETDDIYLSASTGWTFNELIFTKFDSSKYDELAQNLQSDTVAVAHNNLTITSATLTAVGTNPSGTSVTYYMSADGGSNWEEVTNGVEHTFTNTGSDLRWKASLASSSEDATPTIEYLYIDTDAKTMETSGDIIVTANIDAVLTLLLSDTNCAIGDITSSAIETCSYSTTVATNATGGYTGYIQSDGGFVSGSNEITAVSDGGVTYGNAEYGLGTDTTDTVGDFRDYSATDTCSNLDGGTTDLPADDLDDTLQTYASSSSPVDGLSTGITDLCHGVSITGTTPAGAYSQTVTITVIANF